MNKIIALLIICLAFNICFAEQWLTSLEEAQKIAKKENKAILVNFSGSDWCYWCQKLDKEVFSTPVWKKQTKFVLVMIDAPKDKSKLSIQQQQYNAKMQKKFLIQGFPTILLLDAEGVAYATTGYKKGGGEVYLKHLDELDKIREQIADLKQKIKTDEKNKLQNMIKLSEL